MSRWMRPAVLEALLRGRGHRHEVRWRYVTSFRGYALIVIRERPGHTPPPLRIDPICTRPHLPEPPSV